MAIRRRRTLLVPLVAVLVASALTPASAAVLNPSADRVVGASVPTAEDEPFLPQAARGATAVERLGNDLPTVARLNGMSAGTLEELLTSDRTAWVHPSGRVYYVDPAPDDIIAEPPAAAPYPYTQTFQLHSKPDSSRTIYLDFDGHHVGGTEWNADPSSPLPALLHPGFSLDADPTTFSDAEKDLVQSVWQRVSEDYAPFDVDVTTADPGPAGLLRDFSGDPAYGTRALITPSLPAAQALCGNQCGGIAFMGTYDTGRERFQPAWVFPQHLSFDTKAIAEAVSHEVGHNLGLDHDGAPGRGYYPGHGSWAPIMGGSYDNPISQWSRGEYTDATNTEDDLSVITEHGLSFQPDDHGNTVGAATPIAFTVPTATGLVSTAADKDVFALPQGCTQPVTVSVATAAVSPNLDVRLRLLSADGAVLAVDDPASGTSTYDVANGLGASLTAPATGTPLFVEVDGVGAGNPATNGYSEYASIGRYTVTTTGCGGGGTDPITVAFQHGSQSADEGADESVLTVVRAGNTSLPSSVDYARTGGTATPGSDFTLEAGSVSFAAGETQKSVRVALIDDSAGEGDETVQVTLSDPSVGSSLGRLTVATLTITDDDPAGVQPDLRISGRQSTGYIGDGVYTDNGAGQTKSRKARRGQLRSFFIEVTNDGTTTERITLFGTASQRGSRVTYLNEGVDLTRALTGTNGAWVDLPPDQYALVRVDIRIGRKAAVGSRKSALLTAVSQSGLSDVVKATVTVVRR